MKFYYNLLLDNKSLLNKTVFSRTLRQTREGKKFGPFKEAWSKTSSSLGGVKLFSIKDEWSVVRSRFDVRWKTDELLDQIPVQRLTLLEDQHTHANNSSNLLASKITYGLCGWNM